MTYKNVTRLIERGTTFFVGGNYAFAFKVQGVVEKNDWTN